MTRFLAWWKAWRQLVDVNITRINLSRFLTPQQRLDIAHARERNVGFSITRAKASDKFVTVAIVEKTL